MMIKEVQRLVGSDAREPERKLGEFYGHRIDVHAINAGFDDPSSPIGDFGLLLRYAWRHGYLSARAYLFAAHRPWTLGNDLLSHRERRRMAHNLFAEPLGSADKKMPAAHRRIDKVQPQHAQRERVVAAAFLRQGGTGPLYVGGLLD